MHSPAFNFQKFLNDLFKDGWAVWPAMIRLYCKTANLLLFKMCHRIFLKIYLFSVLRICFISYFVMWLRVSAVVWKGPILFQFESLSDTYKITCFNIPCLWYFMRNLNKCFVFCFPLYIYLAKDAEHVNKNIKNKCWNVWYEAYLLVNDDTSPAASSGSSTPATPNMPSGARRPSSNFEQASIAITGLNINGLKKSRKVYCYISKKVCFCFPLLHANNNILKELFFKFFFH